jgi:hypothetical protein
VGLKIPLVRLGINLLLRGQQQLTDLATGSEFLSKLHTEWAYRVVNGGHERAVPELRSMLPILATESPCRTPHVASGLGNDPPLTEVLPAKIVMADAAYDACPPSATLYNNSGRSKLQAKTKNR